MVDGDTGGSAVQNKAPMFLQGANLGVLDSSEVANRRNHDPSALPIPYLYEN